MATLGSKSVGSVVTIKENGTAVNYIIVHKGKPSSLYDSSCDGIWLLRQQSHSVRAWHGTSSATCGSDYENSDIHSWLNGTFLYSIESGVRSAIKTVKIPFKKGTGKASTGIYSGSNGLSCKVFLLSGYEVGFTTDDDEYLPKDGANLSYFTSRTSRSNSTDWWLRSAYSGSIYYACNVDSVGDFTFNFTYKTYYVRPALVLPSTLDVDSSGAIIGNSAPTISGNYSSGGNLGEISDGFNLSYTVNDADGDAITVLESVDGTLSRRFSGTAGGSFIFDAVTAANWQTVTNGPHTLRIVASDGNQNSTPYTLTFNKQVRTATVSLANPLPADDVIRAAVVAVSGHFPEDSTLTILVTNNGLDDEPVWEDMTAEYKQNANHIFENATAANGFAFNFKVTATRGASDEQGYISSIGGAFE